MYITSVARAKELGDARSWPDGSIQYQLLSELIGDASGGAVDVVHIPRGTQHISPPLAIESAGIVLSGDALLSSDEACVEGPGSVAFIPAMSTVSVQAGSELASLLKIYGGAVRWTDVNYHSPDAGGGTAACFALADQDEHRFHDPEMGFFDMDVRWLFDGVSHGSATLIAGHTTFSVGSGEHALHRHPDAEEIFYVWEGRGTHLTDAGEFPIEAGDLVFVAKNEWHGVRNTGEIPMRAIFGYLGVSSLEAGGYQLPQDVH